MDQPEFGSSEAASLGGKARAESLSEQDRSESARNAAEARWEKAGKREKIPRATHAGIIQIGEAQIPCAVLEDGTRMLTQYGYFQAIGRSPKPAKGRGSSVEKMAPFLDLDNLKPFVTLELEHSTKPIVFQIPGGTRAFGYRAETLPKVCDVYLRAREAGALLSTQEKFAKACEIIVRGLAEVGIVALVDEATGYQDSRAKDALAKILEAFVAKELRPWVKTFPLDYYKELYRLKSLTWPPLARNKMPRYFGIFTNDIIYSRLAPGVREELDKLNPTDERGYRKSKNHQWLTNEVGHPKLREHLAAVVALMKVSQSGDYKGFHKMIDIALPKQTDTPNLFDDGSGKADKSV